MKLNSIPYTPQGIEEARPLWQSAFPHYALTFNTLINEIFSIGLGIILLDIEKLQEGFYKAGYFYENESFNEALSRMTDAQRSIVTRLLMPDDYDKIVNKKYPKTP